MTEFVSGNSDIIISNVFPEGDHTPENYRLPVMNMYELVKRPIRKFLYPIYNRVCHTILSMRFATDDLRPDLWLWGQRGNDYERHRARVGRYIKLQGSDVLVAGCGTAQDIESWVRLQPRSIMGVDWFYYGRAWDLWKNRYSQIDPRVRVDFTQADLAHMSYIPDASFDVVSSDAVFEHVRNLPDVLVEFYRILKPGGILYATFGPLWYGFGGDHVSGYDAVTSGYNHLLLSGVEYQNYLDGLGEYKHSEHDGRTWIQNNLFSYLTPQQYLIEMEYAGFKRLFVSVIVDPRSIQCLTHPDFDRKKVEKFDPLALVISTMTIIYIK